ncbi:hypothetical protein FB567DRAFT_615443 [Paraphoma chrysanthemicola]|uniref:Uncharacterized protein n=1 Tax=Paraphoma chrysanthemicola TaxID=798071 RepID=A0A8K0QRV1_9PLEO|nr:hypothetical protein FB567DRAFT_615443 [Paraphoma chrysanthemicola]
MTEQSELTRQARDTIGYKIDGKTYNKPLEARAIPNERLKQVFGIDNAFTTHSQDEKAEFKKRSIKLMNDARRLNKDNQDSWTHLLEQAITIAKEYTDKASDMINISEMVQFITLRLSILYLFPDAPTAQAQDFDDFVRDGKGINELWLKSKAGVDSCPSWEQEEGLQTAIRRIICPVSAETTQERSMSNTGGQTASAAAIKFLLPYLNGLMPRWIVNLWAWLGLPVGSAAPQPSHLIKNETPSDKLDPSVPKSYPMNLILPAYETVWRVVLRSFLEIRYREAPDGDDWSRTMEEYLETLQDPDCMRQKPLFKSSHHNVKPMDIVKEGLRLYPPTSRMHRVFEQDGKTTTAFAN